MDIHSPKSFQGWREFLKEIGTIVIGVLIALGAEQVAEIVHWNNEVAESRRVVATEIAESVRYSVERLRAEACAEHRLDTIATILDAASRSGQLPAVGDIRRPPLRLWRSGAWNSVVASQTATHFPPAELADIAYVYGFVQLADSVNEEELEYWTDLQTMVGPGRRLDPASDAMLRQALGRARFANREMAAMAEQITTTVEQDRLPFSHEDLTDIATEQRRPLSDIPICQPITPYISANYGQAPFSDVLPIIAKAAKHQLHLAPAP